MSNSKNTSTIFLSGGGTGGSVTPLLSLYDQAQQENYPYKFFWVGTYKGIERNMVSQEGVDYIPVLSGKFRRYWSVKNFIDIFKIMGAFFQSLYILLKYRPKLVLSAGGFVSVPLAAAAYVLHIPVIIHQQDVQPGLANKIMSKFAQKVTVTFEKSLSDYGNKAVLTGNPIRKYFKQKYDLDILKQKYNLNSDLPIILILGGGSGSKAINEFVYNNLEELTKKYQIVHISGKDKQQDIQNSHYIGFEFMSPPEIAQILTLADIVVGRAGLGFLTEVSYLQKPTILIPLPDTHQEENSSFLHKHNASLELPQSELNLDNFDHKVAKILDNSQFKANLQHNIYNLFTKHSSDKIWQILHQFL